MDEVKATENEIEHKGETTSAARRDFLKKAGTVAVAAPAAALLLSAKSKSALAQDSSGGGLQDSDIRLKTGIERIGTTVLNLPLYKFSYKGEDGLYSGVMAQDVLEVVPAAVSVGSDGFYRVDYGMLGIAMARLTA